MKSLSDEKLGSLKEIFRDSSGGYSEDRIFQASYVMFEELNDLETVICHLTRTKEEIVKASVRCFAGEFNKLASGVACFDMKAVRKHLENIEAYRSGFRERIEQQNANSDAPMEDEASARCSLM